MSNTINPNQIRPSSTDGQLIGTVAGATGHLEVVAGTGISVTVSGSQIIISTAGSPPAFAINSFTGGQSGELGQAFVNPAFAAAYTGTPTSANITNTDGTDSPHNLTTPYTAATLSGTFAKTTTASTTFTLHATDGTTPQTATQVISWNPRIFGGVGSTGATSSVTASGTTAVLSTTDVLPSLQLGAEAIGQTLGPFSPSGQVIYLLLTGGSHTFVDANTGFPFVFNSPISVSFVNAQGVTVSMFLYQSTNVLFGNYAPKVVS